MSYDLDRDEFNEAMKRGDTDFLWAAYCYALNRPDVDEKFGDPVQQRIEKMGWKLVRTAQEVGSKIIRSAREAWLRTRFLTGTWRGVMLHADHYGKLMNDYRIQGLYVDYGSASNRLKISLNGDRILTINNDEECSNGKEEAVRCEMGHLR